MGKKGKAQAVRSKPNVGGRPPALKPRHVVVLRTVVAQMPHASLQELGAELERRCKVRVCAATIRRNLRAAGVVRLIPRRSSVPALALASAVAAQKRYGYSAAHRREPLTGCSTDLTDAEWALVADLFGKADQRGAPPRYERRHLIEACCATCCAPAAPGGCCRRALRRGRPSARPSCAGSTRACSSRCRTGFVSNGARAWEGSPSRVRR